MKARIITKNANTGKTEIIRRVVKEFNGVKYIRKSTGYMPVKETETGAFKTTGSWFSNKNNMVNQND